MLQIKLVEFTNAGGGSVVKLVPPSAPGVIPAGKTITGIRVTFTDKVDSTTITARGFGADPNTFTFLVRGASAPFTSFVPGSIVMDAPNVARFVIHPEFQQFRKGEYSVRILGNPTPAGDPPIASTGGLALDGENTGAYPSGNGSPGGIFTFKFTVS